MCFFSGVIPHVLSYQILLQAARGPSDIGQHSQAINFVSALAGIIVSHPLEFARVRIQGARNTAGFAVDGINTFATTRVWNQAIQQEGYGSLFRGLTPRTVLLLPVISAMQFTK